MPPPLQGEGQGRGPCYPKMTQLTSTGTIPVIRYIYIMIDIYQQSIEIYQL